MGMDAASDKLYYSFIGERPATGEYSAEREYRAEIAFTSLQRKEEYNNSSLDAKGRFIPENSALYMAGKSKQPLVDELFDEMFPGVYAQKYTYEAIPTFDIDNAYAFRGKGVLKNIGGMVKNVISDFGRTKARLRYWAGAADPYDTYSYIVETCKSFGLRPVFFIQMGNYNNGYDTNIWFDTPDGRSLIRFLAEHGQIGLHPSYASNFNKELLQREYATLADIVGNPITKSRQHFLMLRFPETYRNLSELGISEDYSMGWASQTGYRAGTTRPFLWYDMEHAEFSGLTVFPFPCMDGTMHEYLKMSVEESVNEAEKYVGAAKKYNGVFVPLWHNHSVNDRWEWQGRRTVFEQMMALACP